MTGRFFRRDISWAGYAAALNLVPPSIDGVEIEPPPAQYNIAPSQGVPVIRCSNPSFNEGDYAPRGTPILTPAFWSLIPPWWNKPLSEKTFSTFNCRAETIATSKTFSGAFRQGRCLVPASGFYAWSGPKGASTPFAVALKDRDWFCFAGLWSRAMIDGSEIDTFAIVTCDPNDLVAGLSTSMPVILDAADCARWLDPMERDAGALLRPYPVTRMRAWPAHSSVGNVHNQGADMLGE